jgi:hypothetical protein
MRKTPDVALEQKDSIPRGNVEMSEELSSQRGTGSALSGHDTGRTLQRIVSGAECVGRRGTFVLSREKPLRTRGSVDAIASGGGGFSDSAGGAGAAAAVHIASIVGGVQGQCGVCDVRGAHHAGSCSSASLIPLSSSAF